MRCSCSSFLVFSATVMALAHTFVVSIRQNAKMLYERAGSPGVMRVISAALSCSPCYVSFVRVVIILWRGLRGPLSLGNEEPGPTQRGRGRRGQASPRLKPGGLRATAPHPLSAPQSARGRVPSGTARGRRGIKERADKPGASERAPVGPDCVAVSSSSSCVAKHAL